MIPEYLPLLVTIATANGASGPRSAPCLITRPQSPAPLLLPPRTPRLARQDTKKGKPCYENNDSNEAESVSEDRDLASKSQHIKSDTRGRPVPGCRAGSLQSM